MLGEQKFTKCHCTALKPIWSLTPYVPRRIPCFVAHSRNPPALTCNKPGLARVKLSLPLYAT